jgi:RNA polymerase sigma-70 factor (ECF subfamily)
MDPKEFELIVCAREGDTRAFDALVRRYDAEILGLIIRIIGDGPDAEDVCQDTFIRAYSRLHRFRLESSFRTWVTRIAINQCLNKRRRRSFRALFHRQWGSSELDDTTALSSAEQSDQQTLDNELQHHLETALSTLSDRQRIVFILKHNQGYKIREIADLLHCAEGTVKNTLYRAIEKLQHYFSVRYPLKHDN